MKKSIINYVTSYFYPAVIVVIYLLTDNVRWFILVAAVIVMFHITTAVKYGVRQLSLLIMGNRFDDLKDKYATLKKKFGPDPEMEKKIEELEKELNE